MNKFREMLSSNNMSISLLNLVVYKVTGKDIASETVTLTDEQYNEVEKLIKLIVKKNYPAQYIAGYENFYGNYIKVNKDVLIPRFETEELVYRTIKRIREYFKVGSTIKILDLCTGSGCISVAVFKQLSDDYNLELSSLDISAKALNVAMRNFEHHDVIANIIEGDFTDVLIENKLKFDVIISNPPYISKNDPQIEKLVKKYEPNLALYAPSEGLHFYYKLIDDLELITNERFICLFEIGDTQGETILNYASKYNPQLYLDNFKRERIVEILCV